MQAGNIRSSAWVRGQYPGRKLSNSLLPGIRSIGIWDIEETQDWCIPPHHNEGFEVCMLLGGELTFEVDGIENILKRGSLTLTKPWQKHSLGSPQIHANRLLWFILDVEVRRPNSPWVWPHWILGSAIEKQTLADSITFARQNVFSLDAKTLQIFEEVFSLIESDDFSEITKISALLNLALISLQAALKADTQYNIDVSSSEESVRQFFFKLSDHISHPWKLEEMADECGISRTQFSTLCKAITNQSPMSKLTNLRLEKAVELMASSTQMSITDICFECGFNSSQYFARRFVERFGAAPKIYRKQLVTRAETSLQ